jgi:hypothetical protein
VSVTGSSVTGSSAEEFFVQDPYAVYFASFISSVVILIVGIAGPFTPVPFLGNLFVRSGLFAAGLALRIVMKQTLGEMATDGNNGIWLSVVGGIVSMLLVVCGFSVVMGITRYFTREIDVEANARELVESQSRANDDENVESKWDRRYRTKRRSF